MNRPVRLSRGTFHLTLLGVGLATMIGVAAAQQGPAPAPAASGGGRGGNFGANFTGKVTVMESTEMRMSRIRFEAGARTNWHLHATGQLLLIEEGRGRLQEQGDSVKDLVMGQPVYTKPNVLHWHGASPDQPALQFSVYSGGLEWKQAVTDDEYTGKKR